MTTIAYRDGVLAADTLVTENGRRVGHVTKLAKIGPVLAAYAGKLALGQQFLDYLRGGLRGDPPKMEDLAEGLIVHDGQLIGLGGHGWDVIRADFYALGTGAPVAMGAMQAGASAVEAVAAAAALDLYTGGQIVAVRA